jgi:hypothetical protein
MATLFYGFSSQRESKLVTVHIFEKGEGFSWRSEMNIVYEYGRSETMNLESNEERYRISNQVTITKALNKILAANYKFASSSGSEIQGCLVTHYTFLK